MNWPLEITNQAKAIISQIDFKDVTPKQKDVLRFMELKPSKIKVVIIGQDPYPTKNVANGRAFAVNLDCPIPKSLYNIFQELVEVKGHFKADRTLEHWVKQGVLLLNASLTTIIGNSNAHTHLWAEFIKKVITFLDHNFPNIKWVLWGKFAQKLGENLHGEKIIDAHPSPLSNHRRKKTTFLKLAEIDW